MENLTWEAALKLLKEGNQHFVENKLTSHEDCLSSARYLSASGQKPSAIVLSCADSRVVPELVFDVGIGEIFVIRVAGNVANKHTIASIEYAVAALGVKFIVVMGHENCGAITAAMKGTDLNSANLSYLISYIEPALNATEDGTNINAVVKKNAELTAKQLSEKSDIIKNGILAGGLKVFSAYYNLNSGVVDFFDVE